MAIVQKCKKCGKRSKVKPADFGRSVKCPKCGNVQVAMPRVPPNAQSSSAKPVTAVEEDVVSDGLGEFLECLEAAEAEPAVPKVSGRHKGRVHKKPEAKSLPVRIKPSEIEPVTEEYQTDAPKEDSQSKKPKIPKTASAAFIMRWITSWPGDFIILATLVTIGLSIAGIIQSRKVRVAGIVLSSIALAEAIFRLIVRWLSYTMTQDILETIERLPK